MNDDQFGVIVGLLTQIRDALHYLCAEPEASTSEPEAPGCEHPEANRTDFSGSGETHWVCGDCGYEYRSARRA